MKNAFAIDKTTIKAKSLVILTAIACAVTLPQVFHYLGVISGFGPMPGETFLPMHIPVFVAAFLAGPVVGLLAGAVSPLVSYGFTMMAFDGAPMPVLTLLPFMMIELAGYGLFAGLLHKAKTPVFLNLVIAQLAGRLLRACAVLTAVFILGINNPPASVQTILTTVTVGLPGILLQWALIPLIIYRTKELKKHLD
ncbi:MAG: ECF transporter S component [Oscillospiraceae bacterium]|nr:ECF transporter S component [Oscillospiraceae bacterium]